MFLMTNPDNLMVMFCFFFNLFGAVKKHRAVSTLALLCFVRALSGWRSPAGPGAAVPAGGCAARAAISLAAV